MGCSVKQLLATFDSKELSEWQAYFRIEPFGPWAENLNTGRIITQIRGLFRKKGSAPEKPEDLSLGDYKAPLWVTQQSTAEQLSMAEKIATMFGAKRVKRGEE